MRGATFGVGLAGGILALFGAFIALLIGLAGQELGAQDADSVTVGAGVALTAAAAGIVGASLVWSRPKLGGVVMLISAVVGFVAVFLAYLLGGILLLLAGLLALFQTAPARQD
jgi:hypothetical protein